MQERLYKNSLFVFRRDLRLEDNTALNNALAASDIVIACFIFDPQQVTKKNEFYSANAAQFMIESLKSVNKQLRKHRTKLYLFYGDPEEVIHNIIVEQKIDAVFVNRDYTPFSTKRDEKIEKVCNNNKVHFNAYCDISLSPIEKIRKKDGSFYSVFTAFYNKARIASIDRPHTEKGSFFSGEIKKSIDETVYAQLLLQCNKNTFLQGGREEAQQLLKNVRDLKSYGRTHDYPAYDTSHLSAHLKFGTLSVREVYYAIMQSLDVPHFLIRQLYWRDFFIYIAFNHPTVFGHPFKKRYEHIPWKTDKTLFNAWCTGTTGFPIVDAGMRELNTTGFMHNRIRMIVASFLVKDLHINWLWGERYFAQKLIDYDPAVNNGNWQWIASTGCDAQPYFRIFNPWLQQKTYDPQCEYIKKWIPELADETPKTIHNWFNIDHSRIKNYRRPIVNHAQESAIAKTMYKAL